MTLERLKTLTKVRRLSRREFVQQAIAAGITVAAAEGLFTAMARAEPKKGGRFRMAVGSGSTSDTLDPGSIPDTFNQVVAWGALRSSLTDVTPEGQIVPDLAESFESCPMQSSGCSSCARVSSSTMAKPSTPMMWSLHSNIISVPIQIGGQAPAVRPRRQSRPTARTRSSSPWPRAMPTFPS